MNYTQQRLEAMKRTLLEISALNVATAELLVCSLRRLPAAQVAEIAAEARRSVETGPSASGPPDVQAYVATVLFEIDRLAKQVGEAP